MWNDPTALCMSGPTDWILRYIKTTPDYKLIDYLYSFFTSRLPGFAWEEVWEGRRGREGGEEREEVRKGGRGEGGGGALHPALPPEARVPSLQSSLTASYTF